jgi:hypothetical protein
MPINNPRPDQSLHPPQHQLRITGDLAAATHDHASVTGYATEQAATCPVLEDAELLGVAPLAYHFFLPTLGGSGAESIMSWKGR